MKLSIKPRIHERKSDATRLRREGFIPAIIYHKEKEGEVIAVNQTEFSSHLRHVEPGRLSTTVFALDDGKGKARSVIIKDIQYHPISYTPWHIDFEVLHDNLPVKVKVPIVVQGEADSVGLKLGGMVRLVVRSVKIQCLPKDIPQSFVVDITTMNIGETVRLSDIEMPKSVRPLMKLNSVAVSMVKK